jgi:hypothetical protein
VPKFTLFLSLFFVTFAVGASGVWLNDNNRAWLAKLHLPNFEKFSGPSLFEKFTQPMPVNHQAPDWSKYQFQDLSKTWPPPNFTPPKIQISPPRIPQMPPIRTPYVPPPLPMRFGR